MPNGVGLITGASRGIGLATAKVLANHCERLAIVARDQATADRTRRELEVVAPQSTIDAFVADLASQSQIRDLSDEIHERYDAIKLLVHNAAIVTPQRILTADNIETQFAVNHLAVFLLTYQLFDLLQAAAPARIVVVASQVERGGRINFDDLMGEKSYNPLRAYSQSKLANVMFTYSLAARLDGTGVTVNCLHPGVVRTRLLDTINVLEQPEQASSNPLVARLRDSAQAVRSGIRRMLPLPPVQDWAMTPEDGAKTTVMVATDPSLDGVSGKYFRECEMKETSPQSHDETIAARLWQVSEKLTGL